MLGSLAVSNTAHAEGYFMLGFGSGKAETSDDTIFTKKDQAGSYLRFGYMTEYFVGIEFGALTVAEPKDETADPPVASETIVAGNILAAVVRIPLGDTISLFATAGSFDWRITVDQVEQYTGSSGTYSTGLEWLFGDNWSFSWEVARYLDIGPTETDITHSRWVFTYSFY